MMMNLTKTLATAMLCCSFVANAFIQENNNEVVEQASQQISPENSHTDDIKLGFISDDLFIYFHSGPGTQFRILGSMNAGEEVKVLSEVENDFIKVEDEKQRQGWIDARFLSDQPGLRMVLAELNEELANKTVKLNSLNDRLQSSDSELAHLEAQMTSLRQENQRLNQQNNELNAKLDTEDWDIKLKWFSYGASVLVIGLLLGLILPRLMPKRRGYSSWS
ncbi:TIGR04211 family SH3 domain-containing protein [Thalassotalea aquiviva]|uniref:TIGR04211 family SH3 domain-containing protein n=1 Tax=Thalassotalea aquiviva TaxID=3242415 RepID=UPI003529DC5D